MIGDWLSNVLGKGTLILIVLAGALLRIVAFNNQPLNARVLQSFILLSLIVGLVLCEAQIIIKEEGP